MAAVLASGPGAVLSHRSAADLWELLRSTRARIEVTVPHPHRARAQAKIETHRTRIAPPDASHVRGIPCTSVARTLVDLAEVVDRHALERAVDQAEILELFDLAALSEVLTRAHGRRGAGKPRSVLASLRGADEGLTQSKLEQLFRALCADAALPRPIANKWLVLADGETLKVDFLWPTQNLVVETDGHRTHRTRAAFERDRRRDQRLQLAGYRVVRFTWRHVIDDPADVATTVGALLAA